MTCSNLSVTERTSALIQANLETKCSCGTALASRTSWVSCRRVRIAPPEAPKSGYLFGKGVYFADMAAKLAPYTCSHLSGNVGLFLLFEVALGKPKEYFDTNHDADNLPEGFNSTHGLGSTIPDPKADKKLDRDIRVPCGKAITNPDKKAYRDTMSSLSIMSNRSA